MSGRRFEVPGRAPRTRVVVEAGRDAGQMTCSVFVSSTMIAWGIGRARIRIDGDDIATLWLDSAAFDLRDAEAAARIATAFEVALVDARRDETPDRATEKAREHIALCHAGAQEMGK